MRLVDADEMATNDNEAYNNTLEKVEGTELALPNLMAHLKIQKLIKQTPTADAVSAVHAHWEYSEDGMDWGLGAYLCSNCHARNNNLPTNTKINPLAFAGSHYCPQCCAKMDEKEETNA